MRASNAPFSTDKQNPNSPTARAPLLLLCLCVAVLALLGCTTYPTSAEFRARNQERLTQLQVGLGRAEVLEKMGTGLTIVCDRPLLECGHHALVPRANPFRTEASTTKDGTSLEVLFYYTDMKSADGGVTDDELTPLVLENGVFVGWGWSFLESNVDRYEIRVR